MSHVKSHNLDVRNMRNTRNLLTLLLVFFCWIEIGYASFNDDVKIVDEMQPVSKRLTDMILWSRGFEKTPQGYSILNLLRPLPAYFEVGCSFGDGDLAIKNPKDVWRPAMNARGEWISCNLAFKDVKLEPHEGVRIEEITREFPLTASGGSTTKVNCTQSEYPAEKLTLLVEVVDTERATRKLVIKMGSNITKTSSLKLSLPIGDIDLGGEKKIEEVTTFSSEEMEESFSERVTTKKETREISVPAIPAMTTRTITVRNKVSQTGILFSGLFRLDASMVVSANEYFGLAGISKRLAIPPTTWGVGPTQYSISDIRNSSERAAPVAGVIWLGLWNDVKEVIKDEPVKAGECNGVMMWPTSTVMNTFDSDIAQQDAGMSQEDRPDEGENMDVIPVTDLNKISDCLKTFDEYLVEKTGVLYIKASIYCAGSLAYIRYQEKITDSG